MKWNFKNIIALITAISFPLMLHAEIPESALEKMPPINEIYHPVSTQNPEAQKSFDKGLTYIYAFNHDFAYREFANAARLDPNLAMAYWGMALALGQNINEDVSSENEVKCYDNSRKALQLASNATPPEQAYIKALAVRYTNNPSANLIPLRFKYKDAMKKLADAYPEDLDASTLYAESILDLDPWKYWTFDGKPKAGTMDVIKVLASVLRRNPSHIGANHYNIHAWEASPTPEQALPSAYRLTTLLPAGHLLHMPCHIFILTGNYEEAIQTNTKAIAEDKKYIQQYGMDGDYPLHYLSHNLNILARTYMLAEQYDDALKAALELNKFIEPYMQAMPHLSMHLISIMEINLYFHRYQELLAYTPKTTTPSVLAYWHFSRALAYLKLGDLDSAQKEKILMQTSMQAITESEEIAKNPAKNALILAALVLNANFAQANKQESIYLNSLENAVDMEEKMNYDDPPAWYVSMRLQLGQALLEQKRYAEAENVFRKGLSHYQRNGRLLFGLYLSLKEQGRAWDAFYIQREMTAALKNAPWPLTLADLC